MKKKSLLVFGLVLGTLVGCGNPSSSETPSSEKNSGDETSASTTKPTTTFKNVKLTFGNPITGGDGSAMRQLVSNFNKEYKGQIEITETFMSETEYYESLQVTIPLKRAYNIALVHSYKVSAFANKELLTPLQPILDQTNLDMSRDKFISGVYDSMYFDNKLYCIPLDIHTIILYYNKDLLDKYDLAVPTNRAELLAAAKKMPNSDSGGWGIPLSTAWPSEYLYTTALYQNGGKEIDSNSNPAYNTPAGLTALNMLASIVHEHKVSPVNVGVDADLMMFNQGRAMFHFNGNWMLATVEENAKNSGMNFGVTTVSKMFTDDPTTAAANDISARSHVFVIPDGRMKDVEKEAAMVFVNYMTEHASLWAEAGGHVPANNAARETSGYAALVHQKHYGDLDNFKLNPPSPYWYEAFSPVFSRVTTAISKSDYNGQALLQAAVTEGAQLVEEAKSLV